MQSSLESSNICLASAILVADIVRQVKLQLYHCFCYGILNKSKFNGQVEVNCGERGRALSYVWNTYLTAHERTVQGLKKDLRVLTATNEEVRMPMHRQFAGL